MEEQPLVSIIIPTFNRAHLIGETLNSILVQTYQNWECIVVDDGSTDKTEELLKDYVEKDARFQYHKRPTYYLSGGNGARNYGFDLSKGKFINWFDSDDVMVPNKIELQTKQLNSLEYDFVICQTMMFDSLKKENIGLKAPKLKSKNVFEDFISFKIFWLTGAPLWSKEFLLEHNLSFDEKLCQGQDYDFHMRVLAISENYLAYEEPLVIFNHHRDNMSISMSDKPEKILSNILIIKSIFENFHVKLSEETLLRKYQELFKLYKFNLNNRCFKLALFSYRVLITNMSLLPMSLWKKYIYVLNITVAMGSYFMINKGERFLKIKIR